MPAPDSSSVPSSRRPVPLTCRNDLRNQWIAYQGQGSWVIKDPVALKYHRLHPEQYHVLTLLDGKRSLQRQRRQEVGQGRAQGAETRTVGVDAVLLHEGLVESCV